MCFTKISQANFLNQDKFRLIILFINLTFLLSFNIDKSLNMSVHIMGIFHLPVINNVSRIVVKDRVEKKVNKNNNRVADDFYILFVLCLYISH